jgi:SagB-type dehydrogenase family enzyme
VEAIKHRKSHRTFLNRSLKLYELSFLLWATQGIRHLIDRGHAYRTVPSAGCRHALETYLTVLNCEGLEPGVYRYLPLEHKVLFEFTEDRLKEKIVEASFGQAYPGKAAVTFIWTAIPYRMEWRYDLAAHKVIAIDAGHVCQNLYLACEAIGAGTCAIAAYDQEAMDRLLRIDGLEEFTVYLAPVGKVKS